MRPLTEGSRVTPLELFFDLVFVFALTQVTALMAADLDRSGLLRGLLVLALLWWCWCCYAWLGNTVRADEGVVRLALFAVMARDVRGGADHPGGVRRPARRPVRPGRVRRLLPRRTGAAPGRLLARRARDDAAPRRQLLRAAVADARRRDPAVLGRVLPQPSSTPNDSRARPCCGRSRSWSTTAASWPIGSRGWRILSAATGPSGTG